MRAVVLLAGVSDGVILIETDQTIIWANETALQMHGVSNFHELNVRTYVHAGGRPGVWFFSLDAASSIAVIAVSARTA